MPTYAEGDVIFLMRTWLRKPRIGDVVVMRDPGEGRLILKRVIEVKKEKFFVVGDNEQESTDSRHFGWVEKSGLLGVIF